MVVVIIHHYVKQLNSLILTDTLLKSKELCWLLQGIPERKHYSLNLADKIEAFT